MLNDFDALMKLDPVLSEARQHIGTPPERHLEPGFATLLRIIVDQQVSVASGRAIWQKLMQTVDGVTPEKIDAASPETLRSAGLSQPKTRYAQCLSTAVLSGDLDLDGLQTLPDQKVMDELTAITGIGRWTAEIYLMFALKRPDIWPVGDLALAEAAKRLLKRDARPDQPEMEKIGARWKPYRTAAAVFLWHYYKKAPVTM